MSEQEDKEKKRPRMLPQLEPAERLQRLQGISLPVALGIGVAVAVLLVATSIGLYLTSNLSRIDLSKPKYAEARTDVNEIPERQEGYSAEGPVDQQSIQEAIKILKERRQKVRELGDFTEPVLTDDALGIGK